MANPTLGITGASGQLATGVLRYLLGKDGGNVIAVTRTPDKVQAQGSRLTVRAGDFDQEAALVDAFKGIERLLLIPATDLTPDVRPRQHRNAINAAVQAGVRHLARATDCSRRTSPPSRR